MGREISASSRYSEERRPRTGSRYTDKAETESKGKNKAQAQDGPAPRRIGAEEEASDIKQAWAGPEAEKTQKSYMRELSDRVRNKEPAALINLAATLALIAGYLIAAVYFGSHFYPGTTIFGINCSGKRVDWVQAQVEDKVRSYALALKGREGREDIIHADDVGMHFEDRGGIRRRLDSQLSALWPVMMLLRRGQETEVETVYDASKLEPVIAALGCFAPGNIVEPEDARIEETDSGYKVAAEVMGNKLDAAAVKKAAAAALDAGETQISLEMAQCYIDPKVYQDDKVLGQIAERKNSLLGADLTYDFGDRTEAVNTRTIMSFVAEDEESGGYKIDPQPVWNFVNAMADTYDTFGGTRTVQTSIGTTEILYGGDYGWAMDREETAQELLNAIREKRTGLIRPVYVYEGMSRAQNDIGGTYVEICIARQEMWCYKDGECIVDTPIVTGNPNKGNATPSGGVWAIDAKMQDYTLVGEGYRSPVDYWMPFNGNIGIHDMQSRGYFGSTIYLSHGSHGCVNTPLDAVRQIYEAVEIGTPVIVYEGE